MPSRRPNILFVMADQLAAPALPCYGHPVVQAPHLSALAAESVVFDNAYCAYPLCAPSRASMLTGRLPSRLGTFDNGAEFPAHVPTLVHYLRLAGYRTALSGKMHFVGPDQLHGFEQRLTTDIYPADFGWTADWAHQRLDYSWSHNLESVTGAGPCRRSLQLDYDEETAFRAERQLYDYARTPREGPFFLTVSFTHPHDPYNCLPEHWQLYADTEIDPPAVGIPADEDPHSRRLRILNRMAGADLSPEQVLRARRAYYGSISYVDQLVGRLLTTLQRAGLADDTLVVFTSDHGDLLGERGLWYKMSFFEWSARVPLLMRQPGRRPAGRVAPVVSHLDLLPTLLALAGADGAVSGPLDGHSLVPLLEGDPSAAADLALGEYLGEGALAPMVMIRRGAYKYIYSRTDPPQLYDLAHDPQERLNRAGDPALAALEQALFEEVQQRWDLPLLEQRIIADQNDRLLLHRAHFAGRHTAWDHQPFEDASRTYVRNAGVEWDAAADTALLPAPES